MKKFFAIQLMMLLAAVSAFADNKLVIKDLKVAPNKETTVEVLLENEDAMATFEFYVDVPEGLEVVSLPAATDRIPTNRGTWISQWKNTSETQMYVTYLSKDPTRPATHVQGNKGVVATFVIKASEEYLGQTLKLHVHGVELVDPTDNAIEQEDFDVNVYVGAHVADINITSPSPLTVKAGTIAPITLALNNDKICGSLQFNMLASEGLTFVTDEEGEIKFDREYRNNSDATSYVVSQNADGSYRMVLSNLITKQSLNGHEGDFVTVYVKMDEDFEGEVATVTVDNITLSDETNEWYEGKGCVIEIARKQYAIGDYNEDDKINVTDIEYMIDIIVNNSYDSRYDLNNDGVVNVTDVEYLIDIIINN